MTTSTDTLILNYALLQAVAERDASVTRICLSRGADVDTLDAHGRTPLILTCVQNDIAEANIPAIVDLLLTHGANTLHRDCWDRTALHEAAYAGNLTVIRQLLAAGADVAGPDIAGALPLHYAVQSGHVPSAWELLKHCSPVEVNAPVEAGDTPLMLAVAAADPRMVLLLLENGARTYPRNRANMNAAAIAWADGADDMLQLLYQHHRSKEGSHA